MTYSNLRARLEKIYELPGGTSRLGAMEGMRALAALAVFFVHFNNNFFKPEWIGNYRSHFSDFWTPVFENIFLVLGSGHYGVDFFFILSGFLVARMVSKDSFQYASFMVRRFLRIYPAFLVSLFIYATYYVFVFNYPFWPGKFLGNLFFLNGIPGLHFPPYNFVTWSLWFEFSFYFIFPASFVILAKSGCRHWLWAVIFGVATIIVASICLDIHFIRFISFYIGIAMVFLSKERAILFIKKFPPFLAEFFLIISILLFAYTKSYLILLPIFGPSAAIITYRALYVDGASAKFFSCFPLRWAGNISYSFYLFHPIVIWTCFAVLPAMNGVHPLVQFISMSLICLSATVAVATTVFYFVEKPYFLLKDRVPVRRVKAGWQSR